MAKLIEANDIEQVIRRYLLSQGCKLSPQRLFGETGADIIANDGKKTWFIEVIGYQSKPPIRSREFYEAFFRVISRDRDNPDDILAIGLPMRFKNGMRQRKAQYLPAWEKLGKAFPSLKIWYVDADQETIEEHPWSNPYDKEVPLLGE